MSAQPYSIEQFGEPEGFDYELYFDEEVAWDEEARVAEFVRQLQVTEGITEAIHEDREKVLVNAPDLTADQFRQLVAQIWQHSANPH